VMSKSDSEALNGVNPIKCNQPLSRFAFTPDPLADIQWAVVESQPVRFVDRQKFYGLAVHQTDVFEIESQYTAFLFQQRSEHVHVVPCKSPTDAQNYTTLSDCLSVDFAGHCKRLSGLSLLQWRANLLPLGTL